jgi:hypothetical protein
LKAFGNKLSGARCDFLVHLFSDAGLINAITLIAKPTSDHKGVGFFFESTFLPLHSCAI